MYYLVPSDKGKLRLICLRGFSKLEGLHSRLNRLICSGNTGPELAAALLCLGVGYNNVEMGCRNGGLPDYGIHDLG